MAPVVVLSWHPAPIKSLAQVVDAKMPEHWFYGERNLLYTGQVQGRRVSFVSVPVGAPGTVMMMEEMIVCGARAFIGLGWAGSLQATAPAGTFIMPMSCISEEGTSAHYIDKRTPVGPSSRLAKIIQESCKEEGVNPQQGPVWTTDAPYRELMSKIEEYHRRGILGVDMETSTMYALGRVRNVDVCNLLVVRDELWLEWRPAFGSPQLREATRKTQQVILRVLTKNLFED